MGFSPRKTVREFASVAERYGARVGVGFRARDNVFVRGTSRPANAPLPSSIAMRDSGAPGGRTCWAFPWSGAGGLRQVRSTSHTLIWNRPMAQGTRNLVG